MSKNNKHLSKGFTLIELLVVIAIIAILSTVVIGGLQSARAKGADAGIKANLSNIRAQAELVYDNNGCYADGIPAASGCAAGAISAACSAAVNTIFAEPAVTQAITAAGNASSNGGIGAGTCRSTANQTAWAISVPLKTAAANSWCVDSSGNSKQIVGALAANVTVCP